MIEDYCLPVALQERVRVLDILDAELSDDTRFGLWGQTQHMREV